MALSMKPVNKRNLKRRSLRNQSARQGLQKRRLRLRMKKRELKALRRDELLPRLQEVRKEIMKLNAQVAVGTMLKDPGHLKVLKKSVAKMLTKRKQMEGKEW